jgi:outer membrane protein TolC
MDASFDITPANLPDLLDLPTAGDAPEFLGEAGKSENSARILSLEKALEIAVRNGREYQSRKEQLFLQALSLTLSRHQYAPIFSARGSGRFVTTPRDVDTGKPFTDAAADVSGYFKELEAVSQMVGSPAGLLTNYGELARQSLELGAIENQGTRVAKDRSLTGNVTLGADILTRGGARLAGSVTSDFLRYLTGSPGTEKTSQLLLDASQPLLRGAGAKIAAESLTQAERDLLYALREFARYRQEYTVQVCSDYYAVLQDRDVVSNNYRSFQAFKQNVERERAFAREGRRSQTELGRMEQALLDSEGSWVSSTRRYKQALDSFKVDIGLPADSPVILNDAELKEVKAEGIIHPDISVEDAETVAGAARLDLYNVRDAQEDAVRKVKVARNALKPGVDLVAQAIVDSKDDNRFLQPDFDRLQWNAGVDVDLPLDRKKERNAYRATLIAADKAARDKAEAEDTVKLSVRTAWRTLDQARRSYEISKQAVDLNQRRVEEQNLLAELGRATALNRVDAQIKLTDSENSLTGALITHTIARLQFWRDMGILFIKENGQWEEVSDVPSGK